MQAPFTLSYVFMLFAKQVKKILWFFVLHK